MSRMAISSYPKVKVLYAIGDVRPLLFPSFCPEGNESVTSVRKWQMSMSLWVQLVVSEDFEIFALKEVYLKHLDIAVKRAYVRDSDKLSETAEECSGSCHSTVTSSTAHAQNQVEDVGTRHTSYIGCPSLHRISATIHAMYACVNAVVYNI